MKGAVSRREIAAPHQEPQFAPPLLLPESENSAEIEPKTAENSENQPENKNNNELPPQQTDNSEIIGDRPRRRSTRERQLPTHFGDFFCHVLEEGQLSDSDTSTCSSDSNSSASSSTDSSAPSSSGEEEPEPTRNNTPTISQPSAPKSQGLPEQTEWVSEETTAAIRASIERTDRPKEGRCRVCGYRASLRRVRVHIKQHRCRYFCPCTLNSVSRDSVYEHQKRHKSRPGTHTPLYTVDQSNYERFTRAMGWTEPPAFQPCVPTRGAPASDQGSSRPSRGPPPGVSASNQGSSRPSRGIPPALQGLEPPVPKRPRK